MSSAAYDAVQQQDTESQIRRLERGNRIKNGVCCVALSLAVVAGVAVLLYAERRNLLPNNWSSSSICQTKECITAASRILNAMDTSVDPCSNFFTFACGSWNRDHVIPEDQSKMSTFLVLQEQLSMILKDLLDEPSPGDRPVVVKAKNYYKSCMNTSMIEELGAEPVRELIRDMGGWPVMDGWSDGNQTAYNPAQSLARFAALYGTSGIIACSVNADRLNSSTNILQFEQPSLLLRDRSFYLQPELRAKVLPAYKTFMNDLMAMIAGASANSSKIEQVVDQIIDLETRLAAILTSRSDRRDPRANYEKLTLEELAAVNPDFKWSEYVDTLLRLAEVNSTLTSGDRVVLHSREYVANFTNVIADRFELVQNYMVWRVVIERLYATSKPLRDTAAPYRRAMFGTTGERARWKSCVDYTNEHFPMPTGALYVQRHFPYRNLAATRLMVQDIRLSFKEVVANIEWMDDDTKTRALVKADRMTQRIGYPDYITDANDTSLEDEYESLEIDSSNFFTNIQRILRFATASHYQKLDEPVDRDSWSMAPAVVNAYYQPTANQIGFPAGILRPPFFDLGQPTAMNFGGIGMVIGHELSHGFDDSGSQYDADGNLNDWWTATSRERFAAKASCMVAQYGNETWDVAGANLNGKLTLGENIADNGGVRQAFLAYDKWKQRHPEGDIILPGLEQFTFDQLFFIGQAQVWCSKFKPEIATQLLQTDNHSPGQFRANIVDKNFAAFGRAFNCRKGKDAMYPREADTCRVW